MTLKVVKPPTARFTTSRDVYFVPRYSLYLFAQELSRGRAASPAAVDDPRMSNRKIPAATAVEDAAARKKKRHRPETSLENVFEKRFMGSSLEIGERLV
jgi:hypothetical protein